MNLVIYVVGFCALILQVFSQESAATFELTDARPNIIWTPTSSETIEIHADEGYQIQIDVTEFEVDGENDNSVTVKSISDDAGEANEMMFTYVVSGKPRYLYNNNRLQADYVGTNTSNHVVIQFTRVGEVLTTTTVIPTTSVEPMPSPAHDDKATLTVYLYGLPAASFNDSKLQSLKGAIANMGTEYCGVQNCPLNESITWKNVQIELLKQCSVTWEDYDDCVILTFALPIVKLEEKEKNALWTGYQLNEDHLKILWDSYGSKYLGQIGLSQYAVPDLNVIFKYRIIVICLVIVMLIILVLSARHLAAKFHKKRRRLSDTICIMDRDSDRFSQQSLPPHYLQELPPHFTRSYIENYPEYHMAFAENEEKSMPQPIGSQITISKDTDDLEDAHA